MHPFGVVCRGLLLINISAHIKFEMPSFTRSKDMTGAQNLTRNPAIAEGPRDAGVPVEIW